MANAVPFHKNQNTVECCFSVLNLKKQFEIDLEELESIYLTRSKQTHPDQNLNKSPSERVAILQEFMKLNEAYSVLKAPERRAEHLLGQYGVFIQDNETISPHLLVDMLDMREQLQEAQDNDDHERVVVFKNTMIENNRQNLKEIADLFVSFEENDDLNSLNMIKDLLIKFRYGVRYLEEIEE